jgi:hypothetical protein
VGGFNLPLDQKKLPNFHTAGPFKYGYRALPNVTDRRQKGGISHRRIEHYAGDFQVELPASLDVNLDRSPWSGLTPLQETICARRGATHQAAFSREAGVSPHLY